MKRLFFSLWIFGLFFILAEAQEVKSPDGNVRAVFEIKDSIPYTAFSTRTGKLFLPVVSV